MLKRYKIAAIIGVAGTLFHSGCGLGGQGSGDGVSPQRRGSGVAGNKEARDHGVTRVARRPDSSCSSCASSTRA